MGEFMKAVIDYIEAHLTDDLPAGAAPAGEGVHVAADRLLFVDVGEERAARGEDAHTEGEELEELVRLPFSLPAVGDVRIVAHQDQQPPPRIEDSPEVRLRRLEAALRRLTGAAPILNRRDLRHAVDAEELVLPQ